MRAVVVVGGSWGGMDALRTVLSGLPADFPAPIAVVLHRSPRSEGDYLERSIVPHTRLRVSEVDDKTPLEPGVVYVAPADYHMLVEDGHVALSTEGPVNFSRPSIDVLFESAADSAGSGVIAVVLTGANDDGAVGVRRILHRGGDVIVQDPEGAVRREMPDAAIKAGATRVVPLDQIAPLLTDLMARTSR